MPSLDLLGWTPDRAAAFAAHEARGLRPARVMSEHKGGLALSWEGGELLGSPSARLRATARAAVGDWVAFEPPASGRRAWVHEVLPRESAFVRKAAGREVAEQVVAANVDAVFLCTALGRDLNPRRLERYLALSWQSGARPVVVLTKLDLHPELLPDAGPLRGGGARRAGAPLERPHRRGHRRGARVHGLQPHRGAPGIVRGREEHARQPAARRRAQIGRA